MPMALRFGGGAVASSSSSTPSTGSELTATRPSGSEIGITWVLCEVTKVVLLPNSDGSLHSSSGSSWGSTEESAAPGIATGTVAGSRPLAPGGLEILTQVPSELITTGGYLGSAGLSTNGRELRLGVPKLPPLARLKISVSWSAKEPSALGMRVAGTRDLDRLTGLGAAGADAAGDLSMLPTVRTGFVPALSLLVSPALPCLGQPPMAVGEMVVEGSLWQPSLLLELQLLAAAAEGVLKFGGNLDVVAPAVLDN